MLSGNRNFEGRIHPLARASYLASPPLVVAFALAGRVDIDLTTEPLGIGSDGAAGDSGRHLAVARRDPRRSSARPIDPELFRRTYAVVFEGDERWRALPIPEGDRYDWDARSTYIAKPPFFDGLAWTPAPVDRHRRRPRPGGAGRLGHDRPHLARPARSPPWSPAGEWLQEHGVAPLEFNSYGARRGHHEVMMRGTFANIRLRNRLVEGKEGPYTVHLPDGDEAFIYDAAMRYQREGTPLLVLAGREYGSGSSRDWAAKGTMLLGVRAVLAESYERIHRSNLVGMGVLPLQFQPGDSAASLGLTGRETYSIEASRPACRRGSRSPWWRRATSRGGDGGERRFEVIARLDGPIDVEYYRQGGILPAVLRRLATES